MPTTYGFVGSGDDSGEWFSSTVAYDGVTSPNWLSPGWLGLNDNLGDWMDGSGVYFSQPNWLVGGPSNYYLAGIVDNTFRDGYHGIKNTNIIAMIRIFWDTSLSTPFKGQLFPVGGNSGSPKQVYPF